MRHSNWVLLFVINCNYGTDFVDTSTHTKIISGELYYLLSVSQSSYIVKA